jgi:hypothetical protein
MWSLTSPRAKRISGLEFSYFTRKRLLQQYRVKSRHHLHLICEWPLLARSGHSQIANVRQVPATDYKYCSRTKFSSNGLGIGLATDPR